MGTAVAKKTEGSDNALAIMAQRVAVPAAQLQQTLMQTAFKGATPAEFLMLVAVANKYELDPFVREIYAFPKKGGGIVPLVPIDGWLKVIMRNPDFAGMDVTWSDELIQPSPQARYCPAWVEVTIHHKGTPDHPTVHREWIDEMYRDTGPWNTTTKRMLEWKGIIQAARVAFGLSGIFDKDEAQRFGQGEIIEGITVEVEQAPPPIGEEAWTKLASDAQGFGYTVNDVLASAAIAGHEGPGPEMPRDLAVRIFRSMRDNPRQQAEAPEDGGKPTGDDAIGFS
jgi:phage recombination protein Bet